MAFTDYGGKIILHSWGRFRATMRGTACVVGDLLAADSGAYGVKLADGVGVSVPTFAVACEDGAIGEIITCALAAEIKAPPTIAVGGGVTAGAFFSAAADVGKVIYTGDVGKITITAGGTMEQAIGYVLALDRYIVVPGGYLTSVNLVLTGALTVDTTSTLTGAVTMTAGVNSQIIKGSQFHVTYGDIILADVAKLFWVAPAACKVVSAYETHMVISSATGTLNVEKCTAGEAAAAGDVVLNASGWDMTSTIDTPVSIATAGGAGATLAAGDQLRLILTAATGTSYAGGVVTMLMEWV